MSPVPQRAASIPAMPRRDIRDLVAARYESCHPEDTFEDLCNRARFSKEDRGLLEDWLAAFADAGMTGGSRRPTRHDRSGAVPIVATVAQQSIEVEAAAIASGLGIDAGQVPALMRRGEITSVCETGIGEDEGRRRLTFFFRNTRLSLVIDEAGRLLARGTINFGEKPLPPGLRRKWS